VRGSHGATVASLTDPQNGRCLRQVTLQPCELALSLQHERDRAEQAMNAWKQKSRASGAQSRPRAGGARSRVARALTALRWSGRGLPCDHGRTSRQARATRRYAANDGARNVDFECFLGSGGTRPLHAVPLQCRPNQCANRHLPPPTAPSDIVAFILPSLGLWGAVVLLTILIQFSERRIGRFQACQQAPP
jgi:hypothetical protein